MEWLPLVATWVAAMVGAALQRSTGMGFALVSAPFLVLALGPVNGVIVVNVGSSITASTSCFQLRRDLDIARLRWLVPAGIVGSAPGAAVVLLLPVQWVALVVTSLVLIALLVSLSTPTGRMADGRSFRVTTGLASGFMNTAAGIGGPPIAMYARSIGWARRPFAASATFIFAVQGVLALILKQTAPQFIWWGWIGLLAAIVVGLRIGRRLHGRLNDQVAMRVVMLLALAGTLVAFGRAVWWFIP